MPYGIRKRRTRRKGKKKKVVWVVFNRKTGKIEGHTTSEAKAHRMIAAMGLHAHESDGQAEVFALKRMPLKTLKRLRSTPAKREKAEALEFTTGDRPLRVDREKGVIFGVKIIGNQSRNDRTYPQPVLSKARHLYERRSINISHPSREQVTDDRPFESFFGRLENVREEEGLRGDLHYIKSHPLAEVVCEAAERMPENFGLSHNAHVDWLVKEDGHRVCESVNTVRSVDLVCRPATTNGIFESEQAMADDAATQNQQPAGGNSAPGAGPLDDEDEDEDEEDPLKDKFFSKADEIWDGEGTAEEKADKIGQLAKALLTVEDTVDTAVNGDDADDDDDTASVQEKAAKAAKKQATELADARRRLAAFERREKARDALEAEKVEPTKARITAVAALESEEDRQALIAEFKAAPAAIAQPGSGKAKPKSTPANALESQQQQQPGALPKRTREELKATVHSAGSWKTVHR